MSVMKLIHRPLSDEDLRKLLGSDLRILKYSEPPRSETCTSS